MSTNEVCLATDIVLMRVDLYCNFQLSYLVLCCRGGGGGACKDAECLDSYLPDRVHNPQECATPAMESATVELHITGRTRTHLLNPA